jgi:hypothetical protein
MPLNMCCCDGRRQKESKWREFAAKTPPPQPLPSGSDMQQAHSSSLYTQDAPTLPGSGPNLESLEVDCSELGSFTLEDVQVVRSMAQFP